MGALGTPISGNFHIVITPSVPDVSNWCGPDRVVESWPYLSVWILWVMQWRIVGTKICLDIWRFNVSPNNAPGHGYCWWLSMLFIYLDIWIAMVSCWLLILHLIKGSFMEETGNSELRMVLFSLSQRSLCPVGTCVKRSWSHILTIPEILVSSWHLRQEIMKSHSHSPRDHCVQLAPASRDHEVTFWLAQRSLCSVGTCVKRSWSHILTIPEIIVSSWHLRSHSPRDRCVQLAPASRDHEVTFSLSQR